MRVHTRVSQCGCTYSHLWIYTQGVLWMAGLGATQGCWQRAERGDGGDQDFLLGVGDTSNSPGLLSRTTAVCLQGESLQVVLFYSSLQVLECPLILRLKGTL